MNGLNFKHRIKLLTVSIEMDDLLQEIEVIKVFGDFWADIKTVKGQDLQAAGVESYKSKFRFIIRYVPDVNSKMMVEYNGTRFAIEEILNDNMANQTLTILAETKVGL